MKIIYCIDNPKGKYKAADIKEVSDGYGRYLIRSKIACLWSEKNLQKIKSENSPIEEKLIVTKENKKYWKVTAKCGHVGKGKYIDIDFAVAANSMKEASDKVNTYPRVKKNSKQRISRIPVAISHEEYKALLKKNKQNPYFQAKNIQDQRAYCEQGLYDEVKELGI